MLLWACSRRSKWLCLLREWYLVRFWRTEESPTKTKPTLAPTPPWPPWQWSQSNRSQLPSSRWTSTIRIRRNKSSALRWKTVFPPCPKDNKKNQPPRTKCEAKILSWFREARHMRNCRSECSGNRILIITDMCKVRWNYCQICRIALILRTLTGLLKSKDSNATSRKPRINLRRRRRLRPNFCGFISNRLSQIKINEISITRSSRGKWVRGVWKGVMITSLSRRMGRRNRGLLLRRVISGIRVRKK